jgi:hypothetical protein
LQPLRADWLQVAHPFRRSMPASSVATNSAVPTPAPIAIPAPAICGRRGSLSAIQGSSVVNCDAPCSEIDFQCSRWRARSRGAPGEADPSPGSLVVDVDLDGRIVFPVPRLPGEPDTVERPEAAKLANGPVVGLEGLAVWPSNSTPVPSHTPSPSSLTGQSHTSAAGRWTVIETPICQPAPLVFPTGQAPEAPPRTHR